MIDDESIDIDSDLELDIETIDDKVTLKKDDFFSIIKRLDYFHKNDIDSKTYTHCGICNVGFPSTFIKYHKNSYDHQRKSNLFYKK